MMSDYKTERQFYLKHIYGPIKGKIQILNRNNQEIGFLKIIPFGKTYSLYIHNSSDAVLTISEKRFSSIFELYWGKEIVESQYIGFVQKKKSAFKEVFEFVDAQNNETLIINSNLSGSKIHIDKGLEMKKKVKDMFFINVESTTSDSRTIIYLALCCYLILTFDLQNAA